MSTRLKRLGAVFWCIILFVTSCAGPGVPSGISSGVSGLAEQVFAEKKVEHFSAAVPAAEFEYIGSRPVVHVTTWNHLFREAAVETNQETRAVADYPVYTGSRADAEELIARQ